MQKQAAVVQIDRPDGRDLVVGDEALCMYKAGRVLADLDAALSNSPLRRRCVPRLNRLSRWSSSVFGSVIVLPKVFARPKGLVRRDLNIPAAHFAFDNCHLLVLLSSSVGELDIRPVGNVALTVLIVANGNHRAVCFQTDCVRPFGADCRSIRPFGNIRLTVVVAIRS